MRRIAITFGTTFLPGVAAAHPEHGSSAGFGVLHFLTDPFHLSLTAVALLASGSWGIKAARRTAPRCIGFVGLLRSRVGSHQDERIEGCARRSRRKPT